MYVCMYVYNVNISYEAMVFGASFSPFLLSFFYLVNCCFFIITNMMLDSISHIFPYTLPRLRAVGWNISHPNRMSPEISKMNPLSRNGPIIINYSLEKL